MVILLTKWFNFLLQPLDDITRALVLSLGVCYQARLQDREPFRRAVAPSFSLPCLLHGGHKRMLDEITRYFRQITQISCHIFQASRTPSKYKSTANFQFCWGKTAFRQKNEIWLREFQSCGKAFSESSSFQKYHFAEKFSGGRQPEHHLQSLGRVFLNEPLKSNKSLTFLLIWS